jgi:hypothetical protein
MIDQKWTGTNHDRREMQALNLNQVVRVRPPRCPVPPVLTACPSETLGNWPCSALPRRCSQPGKPLLGVSSLSTIPNLKDVARGARLLRPSSQFARNLSPQRRYGWPLLELHHRRHRVRLRLCQHS